MIQQQYYTREKRGIFSRTPGYDTIAKSNGLDNDFILDTLHQLCFYEAPASLIGESNVSKYPTSVFCVNTEDGKMVIGQSAFAGKDYTGERNRYFTHTYIVNAEEREVLIRNPEKIIYSSRYARDYNIENGMNIPEVAQIFSNESEKFFNSIGDMLSAVGMNIEIFENLIKGCFDAARLKKKIYIILDSENYEMTMLAKGVLKYLYRALPFVIRRNIGFITYMKEPKNKDLINIIFLNKGSIKRFTTEIKSSYVFDLANKNFYLEGIDNEKHIFIDYIIDNIENIEILNEFFYKIDELSSEEKFNIYEYDEIIQFLQSRSMKELNSINYEENCIKKERKISVTTLEETSENFEQDRLKQNKKKLPFIYEKVMSFIKRSLKK